MEGVIFFLFNIKMKKNNIRILIQHKHESGGEFGEKLERTSLLLSETHKLSQLPTIKIISSESGRLTAVIEFITYVNDSSDSNSPIFNGDDLRACYAQFVQDKKIRNEYTDSLFEYLLKKYK